jgi:(+)-pinoresinol hydroxylase
MMKHALLAGIIISTLLPFAVLAQDSDSGVSGKIQRGERLYQYWCATCHGRGPGHPGTQALAERYQGAVPDALADRTDLTLEMVQVFVRTGISIMPFFRKTEINDSELADIGTYLSRNTSR